MISQGFWKNGPIPAMVAVNAASFLSQSVQIGALPALLGLVLAGRGYDPMLIGALATSSWLAVLTLSRWVPRLLARTGLLAGVAASAVVTASATALLALTENLVVMFVLNFCVGVGLVVRWVACDTWIVAIRTQGGA